MHSLLLFSIRAEAPFSRIQVDFCQYLEETPITTKHQSEPKLADFYYKLLCTKNYSFPILGNIYSWCLVLIKCGIGGN